MALPWIETSPLALQISFPKERDQNVNVYTIGKITLWCYSSYNSTLVQHFCVVLEEIECQRAVNKAVC